MKFNPSYTAVSPEEAVALVKSGDKIFIHSATAAPKTLIEALANRAEELRNIQIMHLHTDAPAPYAAEGMEEAFRVKPSQSSSSRTSGLYSDLP